MLDSRKQYAATRHIATGRLFQYSLNRTFSPMENTKSSKHSSGTYWFQQHGDRSFSHQQERQHFWSFASSSAVCWAGCPRCLNTLVKQGLPNLPGRPSCPWPSCQQGSATLHMGQVQGQPRLPGKAQLRFPSPTSPTLWNVFFWPLVPPSPKTLLSSRWVVLCHRQESPAYVANLLQLLCWTLPWHWG